MDVNGCTPLLLASAADYTGDGDGVQWDAAAGCLRLADAGRPRWPVRDRAAGLAARAASPLRVLDARGRTGAADGPQLVALAADGSREPVRDEAGQPIAIADGARWTALGLGGDGRLAAAWFDPAGADPATRAGLDVLHLRRRWHQRLAPGFEILALHVDAAGRIWLAGASEYALVTGVPLPQPFVPPPGFRPLADDPDPLRVRWRAPLPAGVPLALAGDATTLHVLLDHGDGAQTIAAHPLGDAPAAWREYPIPADSPLPWASDLAATGDGTGTLLLACAPQPDDTDFRACDVPQVRLSDATEDSDGGSARVEPLMLRWPQMARPVSARVVCAADGRAHYLAADGPRPWLRLPQPGYASQGSTTTPAPGSARALDARAPGTVWHRLYLEACIPPGCRIDIDARAADTPQRLLATAFEPQPAPVWNPLPSELAYHPGLVAQRRGESGLFELLLQHAGGNVRRLTGRWLQLRLRLAGDGRRTPQVFAVRVYAPRFDYQERYLPELFRQQETRSAPDAPANGADLRERLLAACESLLTPLEARIAAAETLLDPQATPAACLPWLAGFLGRTPLADWPQARVRRWLAHLGELIAWRGTLRGVALALDLATDGAVGRGEIVPVENFRLRRSMATLLGLLPDTDAHPLTLGTARSGNSIVGDSLILAASAPSSVGDGLLLSSTDTRAFLALFAPEQAIGDERAAVRTFFAEYAHRLSVLLHGPGRLWSTVVARVLDEELPAHLARDLYPTEHPFVPGLSPLLGYDTFLEPAPPPAGVRLDQTRLGREGWLLDAAALLPEAAGAPPP